MCGGRENENRNKLASGLTSLGNNDYCILADLDELPNPIKLDEARSLVDKHNQCVIQTVLFQQKANRVTWHGNDCHWWQLTMFNKNTLDSYPNLQSIRSNGVKYAKQNRAIVFDAGWHFSSMGGPRQLKAKLNAYSHQEFNVPQIADSVDKVYNNGIDYVHRDYVRLVDNYPIDKLPPQIFEVENYKEWFGV